MTLFVLLPFLVCLAGELHPARVTALIRREHFEEVDGRVVLGLSREPKVLPAQLLVIRPPHPSVMEHRTLRYPRWQPCFVTFCAESCRDDYDRG